MRYGITYYDKQKKISTFDLQKCLTQSRINHLKVLYPISIIGTNY